MKRRHGAGRRAAPERAPAPAAPGDRVRRRSDRGLPDRERGDVRQHAALIDEADLVYLHVFPYSARAGTPAARMPQVPRRVRKERAARLRAAGARRARGCARGAGRPARRVLVERRGAGRTEAFAPFRFEGDAACGPGGRGGRARSRIGAAGGSPHERARRRLLRPLPAALRHASAEASAGREGGAGELVPAPAGRASAAPRPAQGQHRGDLHPAPARCGEPRGARGGADQRRSRRRDRGASWSPSSAGRASARRSASRRCAARWRSRSRAFSAGGAAARARPGASPAGHPGVRRQRHRQDHHHRQARGPAQGRRRTVVLAAGDTFRAAAIEQLRSGASAPAAR